jgi:hypothetical protein
LDDSFEDVAVKFGDGNMGGTRVCCDIIKDAAIIDPDGLGCLTPFMMMDNLQIYGSKIWMLYKDVCREDLVKMLGMLRCVQMGLLDSATLLTAMENRGRGVDVDALMLKLREKLPRFGAAVLVSL